MKATLMTVAETSILFLAEYPIEKDIIRDISAWVEEFSETNHPVSDVCKIAIVGIRNGFTGTYRNALNEIY